MAGKTQIFAIYERRSGEIVGCYEGATGEVGFLETGETGQAGAFAFAEGFTDPEFNKVNVATGIIEPKPVINATLSDEGLGSPIIADGVDTLTILGLRPDDLISMSSQLSRWPDENAEGGGLGLGETGTTGTFGLADFSLSIAKEPVEMGTGGSPIKLADGRRGFTAGATGETLTWTTDPPVGVDPVINGPKGPGKYRIHIDRIGHQTLILPVGLGPQDYVYVDEEP